MGDVEVDRELAESLGTASFCVVIEDDSMRNASPESVQRGDKVVIDPEITPRPGDLVVATGRDLPGTVFRKYRERGTSATNQPLIELVPLNADYSASVVTLGDAARIVGVMVEHRRARRRTDV